ncbi:hypothetical protein [Halalkalibaculum sp. DA384]|uniref:hypothetical protein n=1 Tax=Halalkalibaculum sp. DA384 TaxID=3373606 RepID=UPI003755278E
MRRASVDNDTLASGWTRREFTAIEVPETLAWSDSSSRYRYHLHLSSEPSFTDTLQYDSTLTAAKWELSRLQSLEKGATFYWINYTTVSKNASTGLKVRVKQNSNTTEDAEIDTFFDAARLCPLKEGIVVNG